VRPPEVDESAVVTVLRVPPELAGQRLDLFVHGQLRRASRTRTQEIIERSAFDISGHRVRSNDRVRAEQTILLWRPAWDDVPVPREIGILFEDEYLLAVDKPAPLPVHPSARYYRNTLIRLLQDSRPGEFLSLGHRLDRETSGILLVAKTPACERALKRQLELRRSIRKTYVAITWGVPVLGSGASEPGASVSLRYEQSIELDPTSPLRVKMRAGQTSAALHAVTIFEVIGVARANEKAYARVRCGLVTGRQHQIRLHLSMLGAPIVGDKLYGPDDRLFVRGADDELSAADLSLLELPRHALHAAEIELSHPITGANLTITAPLAPDLESFWQALSAP
jgi:23S rRNA pseudouridine1911/1915/1917 synthase